MSNSLFTNKTLLITGGTGSFGNAVLNRFLRTSERYAYSRVMKRSRMICVTNFRRRCPRWQIKSNFT